MSRSRSLFESILSFVTLGMLTAGCGQPDTPLAPADVTVYVPGLT